MYIRFKRLLLTYLLTLYLLVRQALLVSVVRHVRVFFAVCVSFCVLSCIDI